MHFWQLFHPLRVLSPPVPPVGFLPRLLRLPRSRSNPFVSLTPIPEKSSLDTDLLLRCVSELSAERWLSGMSSMAMVESGCARRYIGKSQTKISRVDDTYEKLMLSDLEIHPRAFDGGVRRWFPGFVRFGWNAARCIVAKRRRNTAAVFKEIYI